MLGAISLEGWQLQVLTCDYDLLCPLKVSLCEQCKQNQVQKHDLTFFVDLKKVFNSVLQVVCGWFHESRGYQVCRATPLQTERVQFALMAMSRMIILITVLWTLHYVFVLWCLSHYSIQLFVCVDNFCFLDLCFHAGNFQKLQVFFWRSFTKLYSISPSKLC